MRISTNWNIDPKNKKLMAVGYTHAHYKFFETIGKMGIECNKNDPDAPIKLSYDNPSRHQKIEGQYTIGYSNHESSELPNSWVEPFSKVDEIWSPSSFGLNTFKKYYGDKATTVVPHGVSEEYVSKLRKHEEKDVFTFLHVGEPFQRKMGSLVLNAFMYAFGQNENVKLIFKTNETSVNRLPLHKINYEHPNIEILSKYLSIEEYVELFHNSNCLVFPSMGEGFGMITLEALATGMPTISTWEWAEYKDFIINKIDSKVGPVPSFIKIIPQESQLVGEVFLPQFDSVVQNMINVYENYKEQSEIHYENSFKIHEEYSWENVVSKYAIPRLKNVYDKIQSEK